MGKDNVVWTAEDLASIDSAFKKMENSHGLLVAIDRLFFASNEKEAVRKLKESGQLLAKIKDDLPEDLKKKWTDALGPQLRHSVNRAKTIAGKN